MNQRIEGIFIDLGGTFRIVHQDKAFQVHSMRRMAEICGTDMEPEAFYALLEKRYDVYRDWALSTNREAPEPYMWTRWLAPEVPQDLIEANAVELTYHLRQAKGRRLVVEGGIEVIKELFARGYTLGIISDLIGTIEVDEWLDADGLRPYFKTVMQSSVTLIRKPDTTIFWAACGEADLLPEQCAFVGDNIKRDMGGAKKARYGMTVNILTPENYASAKFTPETTPDVVIHDFRELLSIFPKCPEVNLSDVKKIPSIISG